jgi:hypothetical protein
MKKSPDNFPPNNGRFRKVFSKEMEKLLNDYIIYLSTCYYGLTAMQLRQLAYEFAEQNNLPHSFDHNTKLAGKDWLANFMKRNSQISLRVPEKTSLARMQGFNEIQVMKFYDLLKALIIKHKFLASRIYNADETGVPTVPTKLPKILCKKGVKRIAKVVSAERGKTVTLVCSMNAIGNYVPPAFIFPRKKMRYEFLDDAPSDSLGLANKSGWMTQDLFLEYLKHFFKHTRPTQDDPVLLIVDNHSSHLSLAAIDYCRLSNIIMLTLPPHGSHMMQPLDVTFFGPFKTYFSQSSDNWMTSHPGRAITEAQIGRLVSEAFGRAATAGIATKGFLETGIWPFNQNKFTAADFAPSLTSNRPAQSSLQFENPLVVQKGSLISETSELVQSVIHVEQTLEIDSESHISLASDIDQDLLQLKEPSTIFVTPVAIKPIPVSHRVQQRSCRKRMAQGAVVATNSPFRNQVEITESAKKAKLEKKNERAKNRLSKKVDIGLVGKRKDALLTKKSKQLAEGKAFKQKVYKNNKKSKSKSNKTPRIFDSGKQFDKEFNQIEDESPCLCNYCGFVYGDEMDPLFVDDWLSCKQCYNWAHESCGIVIGSFTCYNCRSESIQTNTNKK